MGLPTNREVASIDGMTKLHRTSRRKTMVTPRSTAGATKRRNHFLNTTPEHDKLPRADALTHTAKTITYAVQNHRGVIVALTTSVQRATSYAAGIGGYSSIL